MSQDSQSGKGVAEKTMANTTSATFTIPITRLISTSLLRERPQA